jgi:hypothetical protein
MTNNIKKDTRPFLERIGVFKSEEITEEATSDVIQKSETLYFDKNEKASHFKDLDFIPIEPIPEFPNANKPIIHSGINPYVTETKKIYKDEFTKMNAPEIDFYEFYNSIQNIENKSLESFKMALSMIKSMNPSLTREVLLSQADGYIKRVNDNYNTVKNKGISSKNQINSELEINTKSLIDEIKQIEDALKLKRQALDSLSTSTNKKLIDLDLKIQANDDAYSELYNSIIFVKDNLEKL